MRMRGIIIGVAIGTAVGMTAGRVGRWRKTWGIEPGEATTPLPGDDVVADSMGGETRGITIDAPPEAVWPWLLQMGYGKAGWYSYDQFDQRGRSSDELVDEWGKLEVGDVVPTHPGGGFEVAAIEPRRALVLRSDTALVKAQAEAAKAASSGLDTATRGVQMSGAMLSGTPQQFAASWAFVLEPIDGGRTRLIERFRVWWGSESEGGRFVMPVVGFGVFVMMQKQMIGIRDRAERLARARAKASISGPSVQPFIEGPTTEAAGPTPDPIAVG